MEIEEIGTKSHGGKRLRGELLVYLKDRGGLKYSEIIKLELFGDVKFNSLGIMYKRAKMRMSEWKKCQNEKHRPQ